MLCEFLQPEKRVVGKVSIIHRCPWWPSRFCIEWSNARQDRNSLLNILFCEPHAFWRGTCRQCFGPPMLVVSFLVLVDGRLARLSHFAGRRQRCWFDPISSFLLFFGVVHQGFLSSVHAREVTSGGRGEMRRRKQPLTAPRQSQRRRESSGTVVF